MIMMAYVNRIDTKSIMIMIVGAPMERQRQFTRSSLLIMKLAARHAGDTPSAASATS